MNQQHKPVPTHWAMRFPERLSELASVLTAGVEATEHGKTVVVDVRAASRRTDLRHFAEDVPSH